MIFRPRSNDNRSSRRYPLSVHEVVAIGEWMYDGSAPTVVRVVRTDYDFWFALGEADDQLEPGERPTLNADGHAFYVRHKPGWSEGEPFWPDSQGFMTLDEARREAEATLPGGVQWR